MRYDPALDFALDRPQDRTAEAVMTTWFGRVAPPEALSAWELPTGTQIGARGEGTAPR